MQDFAGRIAVVTGGGTGMGRELVIALAASGCHVAMCDVSAANMDETRARALAGAPAGTRVTGHRADVGHEPDVLAFRDAVCAAHATDHIHLLFNNAGIGGGGSFVAGDRAEWERTFGVCWTGVYLCARAFLPLLVAADAAHIVNTSSVNGFWASIGPNTPHTAYCAAKFAVKGFSEALLTDLRLNAPHVGVSVVMPGHIGTRIAENSGKVLGRTPESLTADEIAAVRAMMVNAGAPVANLPDDDIRALMHQRADDFETRAPTSAAQAAGVILDGVRAGRWRILIGEDAHFIDRKVRSDPERAYEHGFAAEVVGAGHLQALIESAGQVLNR